MWIKRKHVKIVVVLVALFSISPLITPQQSVAAKSVDDMFWGVWTTDEGSSPHVTIEIRKGAANVTINGQRIPVKYNVIVGETSNRFFEFYHELQRPNGSELRTGIYLMEGMLAKKIVLTGYYYHIEYDAEGVARKDIVLPITLKRKRGEKM